MSCSSDEEGNGLEPADAGLEASAPVDDAMPTDAGSSDAPAPRDAAAFDGGALPVVCASNPCATSLVTADSLDSTDRNEAYCAQLDDGTVACWGANGAGQLGRGEDAGTSDSATAARVVGLSDVARLDHTCALDKSGGIWCWGTGPHLRNDAGASTTDRTPVKLPIPPAKQVGVGADVACASVDDGVLCWGRNTNAQLSPASSSALLPPQSIALPSGAPIRDILVSAATFVLREDGVTLSWGENSLLGRISSFNQDPYPLPVALAGISSIDLTDRNACATAGGIGYCWGRLIIASNPLERNLDRDLPEPVVAPEPLVRIATTATSGSSSNNRPQRWCAVGASGAVYCWGHNASGQAGDGTKLHAYQAVKVQGLPETAAQVKAMPDSTCALLTNGKVYCWGSNYYGQLGNGKPRVPSLVPQEVVLP